MAMVCHLAPARRRIFLGGSKRQHSSGASLSKVVGSAKEALAGINLDGALIAVGGFGLSGNPETLLNELATSHDTNAKNLTIASLTGGVDGFALGKLLEWGKLKRLMSSYVGENKFLEQEFFAGRLQVELIPQGTLAQRLQAAGAGIPAFYTPTGAGTIYAHGGIPIQYKLNSPNHDIDIASEPRETREFNGIEYVMEEALYADVSFVKAAIADTRGNLVFKGTARNANPDAAMAGKICIAEAETIVPAGTLDPDQVHLPGVFVHKVIAAIENEKRIERLKLSDPLETKKGVVKGGRGRIMRRAAKEFTNGAYVNLGIGMPTMASNYIPDGINIELQAENGLMGIGPYPNSVEQADSDFINAGKETITPLPGASTFSSSLSFSMIRGGHIQLTILGGLQVSASGDLASWIVPGKIFKGMGGAMDLVGAPNSRVVVAMDHVAKDGSFKVLDECSLPLTGHKVVDRIITDVGVFDCDKKGGTGLTLIEIAPGMTVDDVRNVTGCDFKTAADPIPLMDDQFDDN
jgi:3-oxoacid CoA-transferase